MKDINLKQLLLALAAISFIIILGAGIYEQVNLVSIWASAPPRSLYMFQGQYGIDISVFWKIIHPITLVIFITALIANWKTSVKKTILFVLAGYLLILICTAAYFVPEQIKIISYPYSNVIIPALQQRSLLWEKLNIVRAIIFFGLAFILLLQLIKQKNKSV